MSAFVFASLLTDFVVNIAICKHRDQGANLLSSALFFILVASEKFAFSQGRDAAIKLFGSNPVWDKLGL